MKLKIVLGAVLMMVLLSSCSDNDYLNAIPARCGALLSIDLTQEGKVKQWHPNLPKWVSSIEGELDTSQKIYLFESPEGDFGLCAAVTDGDKLKQDLATSGGQEFSTYRKCDFAMLDNSWLAGYKDGTLLVMGPVTPIDAPELRTRMARYLRQDEEHSIKGTPLFDRLDGMDGTVKMVAQYQALPQKFVAPLFLGVPKDADPTQVFLAATLEQNTGGIVHMEGEVFSTDVSTDKAIKAAQQVYKPIDNSSMQWLSASSTLQLVMNVNGADYIKLLMANPTTLVMLAGVNDYIDMNRIIQSINGPAVISMSGNMDNPEIFMRAQLRDTKVFDAVDSWKKSCPKGSKLTGSNGTYHLSGDHLYFDFGYRGREFYLDGQKNTKRQPLSADVIRLMQGKRMGTVLNLKYLSDNSKGLNLLTGLLGNTLIYTMK